jgi:hypothetical protein
MRRRFGSTAHTNLTHSRAVVCSETHTRSTNSSPIYFDIIGFVGHIAADPDAEAGLKLGVSDWLSQLGVAKGKTSPNVLV